MLSYKPWLAFFSFVVTSSVIAEPNFNMYRWNEDYRYLADSDERTGYQQLKYLPLTESQYLSIGGSLRQRYNQFNNDRFGLFGSPDGDITLYRLLLHTDWHIGEQARVFAELGRHYADPDDLRPGPYDEDKTDLMQAFADVNIDKSRLRLGRQEMKLGSGRLVAVRNGPNIRRAFDGLNLNSQIDEVSIQLLAVREVDVEEEAFDNESNQDELLWGVYSTWQFASSKADIYYLGLDRDNAGYAQGVADEKRHSLGVRIFGKQNQWDWNYEFIYQFGEFGKADISAWTAASVTGYSFDIPWQPRLALSANIASGDEDRNDDELNTFNPLYPNMTYFEEAAVLAPQNFFNIEPELSIQPTQKLSISVDWNFFWRLEKSDAVYVRGLNPLLDTASASGSFVAHVPSLSIDYEVNRYLAFDISYSHFFAGEVIENAGGEDINFFKLELSLTF